MYQRDLKMFIELRAAVKQRFGETVDYSSYEKQIRNMVNKYIEADKVKIIIEQANVFDEAEFQKELDGIESEAAKADTIASRLKRSISEKFEEDPALYKKLSDMIEDAIKAHRDKRLSDAQYLAKVTEAMETMRGKNKSDYPASIRNSDDAKAYYGVLRQELALSVDNADEVMAETSLKVHDAIEKHKIRDWTGNRDVQNKMAIDLEDLLYTLKGKYDLNLSADKIEDITNTLIMVAKRRNS
jgi:type I restriction enzyme R subunit